MQKPTVGVFFGSRSAEHDVSIVTAISAVIKPLQLSGKYDVLPVYIAKDGRWYADRKLGDISLYSSGRVEQLLAKLKPVQLLFNNGLWLVEQGFRGARHRVDIAFPTTHGTHGEDGQLMGVFEMANVPYVGCDVPSSAIAMDKVLAKLVAQAHDLPTPQFRYFTADEFARLGSEIIKDIEQSLSYPLFVKPAHLGSSIAITRVENKTELQNAVEVALHYDNKALVEEAVQNLIEVTQPIMGNDELTLAYLEQPLLNQDGVFDFEKKYLGQGGKGGKKMNSAGAERGAQGYSKLPADIPKQQYEQAQELATKMYRAVGCQGIARVDMLIDEKSGKIFFNEINPLPGSLYFHNWRAKGLSGVQLVEKLINLALERHNTQSRQQTVFESSFLKQF